MALFTRSSIRRKGQLTQAVEGDNPLCQLKESVVTADSNQVITAARLSGGLYVHTGHTASRTDTLDSATNIIAANPDMSIGDTASFIVSSGAAFTIVVQTGAGITATGNLTVPANDSRMFVLTKNSETTMTLRGL